MSWVMAVAKADQKVVRFYRSSNLKNWVFLSTFGGAGAPSNTISFWECPDLIELPIEGENSTRWMLHVGVPDRVIPGAPKGSGGQYFIGQFNGTHFVNDNPSELILLSDWGYDNYAAVSFDGVFGPRGERYWLGWMSNLRYANYVPTATWRNGLTLPRLVSLRRTPNEGLRLVQSPAPELKAMRLHHGRIEALAVSGRVKLGLSGAALELIVLFDPGSAVSFGIGVLVGDGQCTTIGFDLAKREVFVDRSAGGVKVNDHFGDRSAAPWPESSLELRIFVDASSVEVFSDNGLSVTTMLVFPRPESIGVFAFADGGEALLLSLDAYSLRPSENDYWD